MPLLAIPRLLLQAASHARSPPLRLLHHGFDRGSQRNCTRYSIQSDSWFYGRLRTLALLWTTPPRTTRFCPAGWLPHVLIAFVFCDVQIDSAQQHVFSSSWHWFDQNITPRIYAPRSRSGSTPEAVPAPTPEPFRLQPRSRSAPPQGAVVDTNFI